MKYKIYIRINIIDIEITIILRENIKIIKQHKMQIRRRDYLEQKEFEILKEIFKEYIQESTVYFYKDKASIRTFIKLLDNNILGGCVYTNINREYVIDIQNSKTVFIKNDRIITNNLLYYFNSILDKI